MSQKLYRFYEDGEIIHEATLLHEGWEMDNKGWIVKGVNGKIKAITTSHGGFYEWSRKEAEEKLKEIEMSAESIRKALQLWPGSRRSKEPQ